MEYDSGRGGGEKVTREKRLFRKMRIGSIWKRENRPRDKKLEKSLSLTTSSGAKARGIEQKRNEWALVRDETFQGRGVLHTVQDVFEAGGRPSDQATKS